MNNVKVALIQMSVKDDVSENLNSALKKIKAAARNGAQIVCLPEMFCCPYENSLFVKNAEPRGGRIWRFLSNAAKGNHILLIGGTFPEKDGDNLYNTCFAFDCSGNEIARHRKVHMFDIDIPGGQYFRESDTFTPGDSVTTFDSKFGKTGIEVCFDIRFPEMMRQTVLSGAKMVFVPASFNMTTGPAHWQLLFRARALDNQVYMFGCAAAQNDSASYHSYGHSIITSPWGDVIEELDGNEGMIIKDIDLEQVEKIRKQLPVINPQIKESKR